MHRISGRRFATIAVRLPLILGRLMSLPAVVLAFVLLYQGGNEAHVLNGLSLNLHWSESTPEAKLIFAAVVLLIAQGAAARTVRRWRQARAARRPQRTRASATSS